MRGFVAEVRRDLNETHETIVYPSTRARVVDSLLTFLAPHDAVAHEEVAFTAAQRLIAHYQTIVNTMLSEREMLSSADDTREVMAAIVDVAFEEHNKKPPKPTPEQTTIQAINAMQFQPSVPDVSNIQRRCPRCKSSDIGAQLQQTRAADEGPTAFLRCNMCKKQFR